MEINLKKLGILLLVLWGVSSCNDSEDNAPQDLTSQEVVAVTQADELSINLDNIIDFAFSSDGVVLSGKSAGFNASKFPDCVMITTVETQESIEKTISFDENCELPGGYLVSGEVKLTYANNPEATSVSVAVEFTDFVIDGIQINGTKQMVWSEGGEGENPSSTYTTNITIVWPDGSTTDLAGTRTREWVEGYGIGEWADNVYEITGNWVLIAKTGDIYSGEITTPLRVELTCPNIVSGVIHLVKNQILEVDIDFGDGTITRRLFLYLTEIHTRSHYNRDKNVKGIKIKIP